MGEALRMADVFISYKSEDRVFAQTLAQRLGEQGFTIWHDQGMGADSEYHKQIAVELAAAKVIVALWSARSLDSRWVYSEADEGDKASKQARQRLHRWPNSTKAIRPSALP